MTILQNAYKGYLTKKYEKEINEFKELALKAIENEIKTIEARILSYVKRSDDEGVNTNKDSLKILEDLKYDILHSTLSVEEDKYDHIYSWIVGIKDNYKALNDLIVEGESKFMVFKPTHTNDDDLGEGRPVIDEIKMEGNVNLTGAILSNSGTFKWDSGKSDQLTHYLDKVLEEARKTINIRVDEIDNTVKIQGAVDFSDVVAISSSIGYPSGNIAEALTKLTELLSDTIKKFETTSINVTLDESKTSAKQFATDILNEIRKKQELR